MLQRALMDAIPDPIFIRDLEGRLIMCNKSYEEQFATRFEKLRGTRLTDSASFPPATAELLHGEVMDQLRTGQSRFVDRQLMFSGGLRKSIIGRCRSMGPMGTCVAFWGLDRCRAPVAPLRQGLGCAGRQPVTAPGEGCCLTVILDAHARLNRLRRAGSVR